MTPRRPPDRLNRVVLAVLGAVVASASTAGLLVSFGAFGGARSHQPVLSGATRHFVDRNARWWWPTAAGLALLLAFLGYRWLRAQLPVAGGDAVHLAAPATGTAVVAGRALGRAIAADAERFPGVRAAAAQVEHGPGPGGTGPNHLTVALRVRGDDSTATAELAVDLRRRVLANAGRALDTDETTATVRLDLVAGPNGRGSS